MNTAYLHAVQKVYENLPIVVKFMSVYRVGLATVGTIHD